MAFKSNIKKGVSNTVAAELLKSTNAFFKRLNDNVVSELGANVNIRTGLLKKSLKYKVQSWRNNKTATKNGLRLDLGIWAAVGIDRDIEGVDENGNKIWPVKYAHLVEFGHGKGTNNRGGDASEKPFMRPAIVKAGGVNAIRKFLAEAFLLGMAKS